MTVNYTVSPEEVAAANIRLANMNADEAENLAEHLLFSLHHDPSRLKHTWYGKPIVWTAYVGKAVWDAASEASRAILTLPAKAYKRLKKAAKEFGEKHPTAAALLVESLGLVGAVFLFTFTFLFGFVFAVKALVALGVLV